MKLSRYCKSGLGSIYGYVMVVLILLTLFIVGYSWSSCQGMGTAISVLILVGFASISVGFIVGHLFAFPRARGESEGVSSLQVNNNLAEVSDWVTKMMLGIGLSQFNELSLSMQSVALYVSNAIVCQPNDMTFSMTLMIVSVVLGFFTGFQYTRLSLSKQYSLADKEILSEIAQASNSERYSDIENVLSIAANAVAEGFVSKGKMDGNEKPFNQIDVLRRLVRESESLMAAGRNRNPEDPNHNTWGGHSTMGRFTLSAQVNPWDGVNQLFKVTIQVEDIEEATGACVVALHSTFKSPIKPLVMENGKAELSVIAYGAFTVGALVMVSGVDDPVMLELDLSDLESAPPEFRER
jgi:hypothetical protein